MDSIQLCIVTNIDAHWIVLLPLSCWTMFISITAPVKRQTRIRISVLDFVHAQTFGITRDRESEWMLRDSLMSGIGDARLCIVKKNEIFFCWMIFELRKKIIFYSSRKMFNLLLRWWWCCCCGLLWSTWTKHHHAIVFSLNIFVFFSQSNQFVWCTTRYNTQIWINIW